MRHKHKIVWFFLRQHESKVIILAFLSLLVGGLEALSVVAVYPILTAAFDSAGQTNNFVIHIFRKLSGLLPVNDLFIGYSLLFVLIAALAFISKCIFIHVRLRFSAWLVEKKQNEIFNKYMKADYTFFINNKQGELIYDVGRAPIGLSNLIISVTSLISEAILSLSVFGILFALSWKGALAIILVGIIYLAGTRYLARKISYSASKAELESTTEYNVILNEAFNGIREIKVFDNAGYWMKMFSGTIKKCWYEFQRRNRVVEFTSPVLMVVLYFFMGISAITTRILFPTSFIEVIPVFGTFAFAIFRLVPIAAKVGGLTMSITGELPNCERCYSIMDRCITNIKDGEKELNQFNSEVMFDKVSFTYEKGREVLKDISVSFQKGKTTAIVGRSGSGKTTIVNLILRLFDPNNGEIKIDNVNIKEYRTASLMSKIGFVSQDTFAFNDTVRNNITFGLNYTDEEVSKASLAAHAHGFISELSNGYDTLVGDKGVKLSGGQRQRIAIARAMIRRPEILIFDEATNALDNISQLAVQEAIEEISKDHTVIIIAHRLSTISKADKIIVLENGKVAETGSALELMEKKGSYWKLYQSEPADKHLFEKDEKILNLSSLQGANKVSDEAI